MTGILEFAETARRVGYGDPTEVDDCLRRWLGSANNKPALKKRVAAAIEACPKKEHSQLALLHVLDRKMFSAAKLLAGAAGLGWCVFRAKVDTDSGPRWASGLK